MKKLIMIILITSCYPIAASVNCLDNSSHLAEDIDYHEIRSVACDCPCTVIKGNKCIECGHLQNASTYVVVLPTKVALQKRKYPSYDPKAMIRQLAYEYLQNKKN